MKTPASRVQNTKDILHAEADSLHGCEQGNPTNKGRKKVGEHSFFFSKAYFLSDYGPGEKKFDYLILWVVGWFWLGFYRWNGYSLSAQSARSLCYLCS